MALSSSGFATATLVCSNGQHVLEVQDLQVGRQSWSGMPCGSVVVSMRAGAALQSGTQTGLSLPHKTCLDKRIVERRVSMSAALPQKKITPSAGWTLTVLSHSKEISTSTKHILKIEANATVGDMCISFLEALLASGGFLFTDSPLGYTTSFAIYSTRKMEGIPLNSTARMDNTLNSIFKKG
eukprot:CAMPEP_0179424110 /NCGR_PEP_ID=MMETSP0799-20121207/11395_1 /TAXON_ID=46947 /ORGANISM="Geminigera cryophila, Strain CCMP2564" /LENGTH=181 /DNA_ID=CAMNT_0021198503 /DNA_START=65 /DNA_END=606 /DNA_ORIENTATION=-